MKETEKIREEMKYIIHELMDRKISQQAIMESCCSQKNRNKILKLLEFIKDEELILTETIIWKCLESEHEVLGGFSMLFSLKSLLSCALASTVST